MALEGLRTPRARGVQCSVLAGVRPLRWPQGSPCSTLGQGASPLVPQTTGISARLLCFQELSPPHYSVCLPFPISSFQFCLCASGTLSRPKMGCLCCLRMRPTCLQLPAGSAPRQVLLSFPWRAPSTMRRSRTAGRRPTAWEGPVVWTRSFQFPPALGSSVCRGL